VEQRPKPFFSSAICFCANKRATFKINYSKVLSAFFFFFAEMSKEIKSDNDKRKSFRFERDEKKQKKRRFGNGICAFHHQMMANVLLLLDPFCCSCSPS
jgi:hypothetical protein